MPLEVELALGDEPELLCEDNLVEEVHSVHSRHLYELFLAVVVHTAAIYTTSLR